MVTTTLRDIVSATFILGRSFEVDRYFRPAANGTGGESWTRTNGQVFTYAYGLPPPRKEGVTTK